MTAMTRVKRDEKVTTLKKYVANGSCDLMDVTRKVYDLYLKGYLAYDEANEAIRQLARVKIGQKI